MRGEADLVTDLRGSYDQCHLEAIGMPEGRSAVVSKSAVELNQLQVKYKRAFEASEVR